MWFQILLIPFLLILIIFFIFWIVREGSRWQTHPQLGVFARFIQASPKRSFFTFLTLFFLLFPAAMLLMSGLWMDALGSEIGPRRVDVVNVMLITFLSLAMSFPIMYSSLGIWRNAKRAEAEMKVRPMDM